MLWDVHVNASSVPVKRESCTRFPDVNISFLSIG